MPKPTETKDLKNYLQTNEEISDEMNEDIEHLVAEEGVKGSRKTRFYSNWSKKKKITAASSVTGGVLLLTLLILLFVIRPSRTNSYIKNSWHDLVSSSSDISREVKDDVDLAGTRDLANGLYSYNQKLSTVSYNSKAKSSFSYVSGKTKEYGELTKEMGNYFSKSADMLTKIGEDETSVSDEDFEKLQEEGVELKAKLDSFREKNRLQEELDPNLFSLDVYLKETKSKTEEIKKEKAAEEKKKKDDAAAALAKDTKDKASVNSLADSYYKAFINGNEAGVKATLSKGYQTEYDFASLAADRRISFYPKAYRVVTVAKDGDNYKLTSSVTYVSVYQDSDGNDVETVQPITEIFRVVFSSDYNSWKIDGRVDS